MLQWADVLKDKSLRNLPYKIELDKHGRLTLYLAKGAHEVWICTDKGKMTFRDHTGELKHSKRVPRFPSKITIQ